MKKFLVISAVAILAVLVLGVAGFAYAQSQTPPPPDDPTYGPGMMGRWSGRGFGQGMMGRWDGRGFGMMGRWGEGGYGPMHEYMVDAFAEALNLTHEELEAKLGDGETMWSIAQAQGLSDEEIADLMVEARTKALEQAVADGVLTQEQADWMIQRMQEMQSAGFGPGYCHGFNGQNGGPGWRNNP